ncbi:MAG: hypothetical protein C4562_07440 [Actinobacteria bacterium]|nr:MAG: hypothetical protein C4562_07440 [Actinomycetota bacterium]
MTTKGLIQVFSGDGRGKTSAAFGLAMRAAGHGLKVAVVQFMKPTDFFTGENNSIKNLSNIDIYNYGNSDIWGRDGWPQKNYPKEAKTVSLEALNKAKDLSSTKGLDLLVLDEAGEAAKLELLTVNQLKDLLNNKENELEIIITGYHMPQEIIDMADLVTELKAIKHPYEKGITARRGFDY